MVWNVVGVGETGVGTSGGATTEHRYVLGFDEGADEGAVGADEIDCRGGVPVIGPLDVGGALVAGVTRRRYRGGCRLCCGAGGQGYQQAGASQECG